MTRLSLLLGVEVHFTVPNTQPRMTACGKVYPYMAYPKSISDNPKFVTCEHCLRYLNKN